MSVLQSLKLVSAKKSPQTPIAIKRNKLANKLQEQIELINAQREGRTYAAKRTQWTNDTETGARIALEVDKRVREWYWTADTGKINAVIKYGAATLALGKGGKNAIEAADLGDLLSAFSTVKQAVISGELDDAITEASVRTRKGFGK